jgi:hypothetical protein
VRDDRRQKDVGAKSAPTTEPWVKATDRVLVRIAELNDGVYDPQKHSQQLATAAPSAGARFHAMQAAWRAQ